MVAHFEPNKAIPEPYKVATAADVAPGANKRFWTPQNLYPPGYHPLGWNQITDFAADRNGRVPV